jgi:hypothetical protein
MNKTIIIAVAAALIACFSLAACSARSPASVTSDAGAHETTSTTSQHQEPVVTSSTPAGQTSSNLAQEPFRWRPDAGDEYGSHAANRCADGIIDGEDGVLYYQGVNPDGDIPYGLYTFDEKTKTTAKLTDNCFGMVNVSGPYVFYRGYPNGWLFRYTLSTNEVKCLYSRDDVWNVLTTKDSVYFIDRHHNLRRLAKKDGQSAIVAAGVAGHYLEYLSGHVYFGRLNPDEARCDLYRVEADSIGQVESVCKDVGYLMGCVGTKVLFGDDEGVQLRDWKTGKKDTVFLKGNGALLAAVNGNGVFYVTRDPDGYSELRVFDVETRRTSVLMPVHCGTVSFVDGSLYLVGVTDLAFERALLDAENPHTEWLVERGITAQ